MPTLLSNMYMYLTLLCTFATVPVLDRESPRDGCYSSLGCIYAQSIMGSIIASVVSRFRSTIGPIEYTATGKCPSRASDTYTTYAYVMVK